MSSAVSMQALAGVSTINVGTRFGVKGADAAGWLAQRGITVPAVPNSIARWQGGRCLRLGHTEFLVELDEGAAPTPDEPARAGFGNAWLLLRSDHGVILEGAPWPAGLAQACSFDFTRLNDEPDRVVMTLLAGIAVTLARESAPALGSQLALRLWCDASYATYLHQCLQQLAAPGPDGE